MLNVKYEAIHGFQYFFYIFRRNGGEFYSIFCTSIAVNTIMPPLNCLEQVFLNLFARPDVNLQCNLVQFSDFCEIVIQNALKMSSHMILQKILILGKFE
ncbi:hypothetical protein ASC94_07000 [Massilia sp. Root418]|nr:hypothetical protein ASC94_07000 [Massilia sp. Root418]